MAQSFLNVAIPINDKAVAEVNQQLEQFGNPASDLVREALRDQGIHFMSMTVIQCPDESHSPHLIIEASLDGIDDEAIDRLLTCFHNQLLELVIIAGHKISDHSLATFLKQYRHKTSIGLFGIPGLNFSGCPGMSVERIHDEFALARKCRTILENPPFELSALERVVQVRNEIANDEELSRLLESENTPLLASYSSKISSISLIVKGIITFTWPALLLVFLITIGGTIAAAQVIGYGWALTVAFVVFLMGLIVLASILLTAYLRLRSAENRDIPDDTIPDYQQLSDTTKRENRSEQNHMAGVSIMKSGLLRRFALKIVFWVITQFAQHRYRPGFLGELGTIHFARWILLPGTDKLLFFSNYGGSWESYLEDFITKANTGLTGVWSNTVGFPRTSNLFTQGATDGDRFKRTLGTSSTVPNVVLVFGLPLFDNCTNSY